ncbi:MAG: MerR family transcriptional regulator [Kribbellaceae bacterium]
MSRSDAGIGLWTLDQLTGLVEAALAVDYPGQVNGRVRAVPDRRAIRWYATIGLVDRPAEMRGRTAVYGRRHLLQLVAIKRRQAQGRTLAEIQAELSGATDGSLETIASLPTDLPELDDRESASARASMSPAGPPAPAVEMPQMDRQRFWSERPAAGAEPTRDDIGLVTAVRLADGVTVMLDQTGVPPASPGPAELAALRAAAAPLLAELARQRLAPAQPQSAHRSGDST